MIVTPVHLYIQLKPINAICANNAIQDILGTVFDLCDSCAFIHKIKRGNVKEEGSGMVGFISDLDENISVMSY